MGRSYAEGLAIRGSDIDATVAQAWDPGLGRDERREAAKGWLRAARSGLPVRAAHLGAKAPVLQLEFAGRHIDLTYGNDAAVAKSALVARMVAEDPVLSGACVLFRCLAKHHGVYGQSNGFLSGYALTQMVLFAWQCGVVPLSPPWTRHDA